VPVVLYCPTGFVNDCSQADKKMNENSPHRGGGGNTILPSSCAFKTGKYTFMNLS
jgi:hypothetical protein